MTQTPSHRASRYRLPMAYASGSGTPSAPDDIKTGCHRASASWSNARSALRAEKWTLGPGETAGSSPHGEPRDDCRFARSRSRRSSQTAGSGCEPGCRAFVNAEASDRPGPRRRARTLLAVVVGGDGAADVDQRLRLSTDRAGGCRCAGCRLATDRPFHFRGEPEPVLLAPASASAVAGLTGTASGEDGCRRSGSVVVS
jgi:hypothetical protein